MLSAKFVPAPTFDEIKTRSINHYTTVELRKFFIFRPIKRLVFDNLTGVECAVDVSGKKGSGESKNFLNRQKKKNVRTSVNHSGI